MKIIQTLSLLLMVIFMVYYIAWDNARDRGQVRNCKCVLPSGGNYMGGDTLNYPAINEALLASRFSSLEELKSVVQIEYHKDPSNSNNTDGYSMVHLRHCSNDREISSILESGLSQQEIMNVRAKGLLAKVWLLAKSPFTVANRINLIKIYNLARRKPMIFGEGDVAFYDLAETSVKNISTLEQAFIHPRDSSDKGYLNSFNHITAQAIITSCFSEEMADFMSDVHERKNMSELTTGKFTKEQLADLNNNHVDNYVDMINNEWGQEIGKALKKKYKIGQGTFWTPELLANYLNDLQSYYSWAYQIGFKPFSIDDELIIRYANKINVVMQAKVPM